MLPGYPRPDRGLPESRHIASQITELRRRLSASASGFVRAARLSGPLKLAAVVLIDRGEVERFASPLGTAYRFKRKDEEAA